MSDKVTDAPDPDPADSSTTPAAEKPLPETDSETAASIGTESSGDSTAPDKSVAETISASGESTVAEASTCADSAAKSDGGSSEGKTSDSDGTVSADVASTEKDSGTAQSSPDEDNNEPSAPDSDTAEASAEPRARRIRRPRLGRAGRIAVSGVVAILFIAAVASSVYFYLQNQHNKTTLTAREQARDTACKYGPVLATYDAKHLDTYFQAVLAGATGDWHKQFDSTSKDLRDVLVKGEVATTVNDVQCAIVSGDATSAQAIVVVGQSITSLGTQGKPEPGQLSISMRLEKDGGRWLVDKVDSPLATTPGS
ncbi:hypothetical protein K7711_15005 [Nocardia sp. CA2R105]|uniref:hypothetical protein n=1 Tax=Nocardia coffeae TaxID=2873381 RepID=UPI001CA6AC2B|nr:hypothetical protein [Nocardia coffeae]MBY8857793.1 hypothetical protein [Nocardia coffeae]